MFTHVINVIFDNRHYGSAYVSRVSRTNLGQQIFG
jgi:hypothetical protein